MAPRSRRPHCKAGTATLLAILWFLVSAEGFAQSFRELPAAAVSYHVSNPQSYVITGNRVLILGKSRIEATANNGPGVDLRAWGGAPSTWEHLLSGSPLVMAANSTTAFLAFHSSDGFQFWATDGTGAGTRRVLSLPGYTAAGEAVIPSEDGAYLIRPGDPAEVWTSDGTAIGTRLLAVFPSGTTGVSQGASLGGKLIASSTGGVIYSVDAAGAVQSLLAASSPTGFLRAGNRLVIATQSSSGPAIWSTDGTPGGTAKLLQVSGTSESRIVSLSVSGGLAYFTQGDPSGGTWKIWRTDGTAQGTLLFEEMTGPISALAATTSELFVATPGVMWRTDGTEAGTRALYSGVPGRTYVAPQFPALHGNGVAFVANAPSGKSELWVSDGTTPGTRPVDVILDATPLSVFPQPLCAFGGKLLLRVWEPGTDRELASLLAVSDGTAAGTGVVRDTGTPPATTPFKVVGAHGRTLLLSGGEAGDKELWAQSMDGGTPKRILDIVPGPLGSNPFRCGEWGGWTILLAADAGSSPGLETGLWKSDGTSEGTSRFADGPSWCDAFLARGDHFLFSDAYRLWRSDLTASGTSIIAPLTGPGDYSVGDLVTIGAHAYAIGFINGQSYRLIRTDGTPEGTSAVVEVPFDRTDIYHWPELISYAGSLFLVKTAGPGTYRLLKSDGTAAGTTDFRYGPAGNGLGAVSNLLVHGDKLYFFDRESLWVTDGTEAGTRKLASIPGMSLFAPEGLNPYLKTNGPFLLFRVLEGFGGPGTTWRTDGTEAGTFRLEGPQHSLGEWMFSTPPDLLPLLSGRVYFPASARWDGAELWETDGTQAGTRLISFMTGPGGSNPREFQDIDGTLVFKTTGVNGTFPLHILLPGCAVAPALPPPAVSVRPSGVFCSADRLLATAAGPFERFEWSDGFAGAERSWSDPVAQSVRVVGIDTSGCASLPASISVEPPMESPRASLAPAAALSCPASGATLTVTANGVPPFALTWSDGYRQVASSSPVTRLVSPAVATTYFLTGFSDSICSGDVSGTAVVEIEAPAEISSVPGVCANSGGYTATVAATVGASYSWWISNGSITGGQGSPAIAFTAGTGSSVTLSVVVTKGGCSRSDQVSIPVSQPPAAPVLLGPANGDPAYGGGSLTWTQLPGMKYAVYLDTVSPPVRNVLRDRETGAFALAGWLPGVTYFWQVAVLGPCGEIRSEIRSFVAGSCPWTGAAPEALTPTNGFVLGGHAADFSWTPVPGTAHYDLYLGTSPDSLVRYASYPAPAVSASVPLNPGTTYFWRLRAVPGCGSSAAVWSAGRSFSTATAAVRIDAVTPSRLSSSEGGDVRVWGSGFQMDHQVFGDLGDQALAPITQGLWQAGRLDAHLAAGLQIPSGRYDVGVRDAIERARVPMALVFLPFADVSESDYYFESSSRAILANILERTGTTEGGELFKPHEVMTRAEFATSLARAYQWVRTRSTTLPPASCVPLGAGSEDFPDVPCSHPRWPEIHFIKSRGVTVGAPCPEGLCFLPERQITRAEVVTFILRLEWGPALASLLSGIGETDPGCALAYPGCSGWADASMQLAGWPRREANVAFATRLTTGCAGSPGNGLAMCPMDVVTRAQTAEFLSRTLGLVPSP